MRSFRIDNVDPPDGTSCVLDNVQVHYLERNDLSSLIQWIQANVRDYPFSGG